jgi:hypothetical protein
MTTKDRPLEPFTLAPAELADRFTSVARSALGRAHDAWLMSFSRTLAPLKKSTESLAGRIGKIGGGEPSLPEIWSQMEGTFDEYLAWTRQLSVEDSDWFSGLALDAWETESRKTLEDLPAVVKVAVAGRFWEGIPEDSPPIRAWKWAKRRRRGLGRAARRVRNSGRKIIRKPPLPPAQTFRTLNLRELLESELVLPAARILLCEWQRFLQQVAVEFFYLHEKTEAIENESLFRGDPESARVRPDPGTSASIREKVLQHVHELAGRFERIGEFNAASLERFGESWAVAVDAFRKKWEPAGTFALPNRTFGRARNVRSRRRLNADFEKARQAWAQHFCGEKQEWQKDLELCRLQIQTARILIGTLDSVSGRIDRDVVPSLDDTLALIKREAEKIKTFEASSKGELKKFIIAETKALSKDLRQNRLPHVVDALVNADLEALFREFSPRVKEALSGLSEPSLIFRERDLKGLVPASKIDEVPVRALVLSESFPRLERGGEKLLIEVRRVSDEIFREVAEIDQIVDYNSESALSLLEEKKGAEAVEEARRMAGEGLDRAYNQAAGLIAKIRSIASLGSKDLASSSEEFLDRLQDLENSEKIIPMKIRYARTQAKQRILGYGVRAWARTKALFADAIGFARRNVFVHVRAGYLRLRKLSGLTPGELGLEDKLAVFLHRTQIRVDSLPYVYQRLFRIEPLTDKRFYIGRDEEKAQLKDSLLGWKAGRYSATALVGEKGSGKTTVLNDAEADYFAGLPLRKIDLVDTTVQTTAGLFGLLKRVFDRPDAEDLDALERELAAGEEKTVCVLENSQNMFLRTVGGFEAIERFLLFMSRTDAAVLWIVTCTLYSWNYLDRVLQVSKYFKTVVELGALTREETTDLIMKRHRISGYPLRFEIPEPQAQPRKFRKIADPDEQQAFLQGWFFEQLNRLASGNVAVALWFWLGAIKSVGQEGFTVTPFIDLDYSFLHQMGSEEMFTLAALLQHETLTAEEHALIFRQGIDESLLLLNRLLNKKYLTFTEGRFAIHPLLYRPSVAALKAKNIVH